MIRADLRDSQKYQDMMEPYIKQLRPTLEKAVNKKLNNLELLEVCRYLKLAEYHKKKLSFDFSKEDSKACLDLVDTQMYFEVWGSELLYKMGGKRYLEHVLDSMNRIINNNQTIKLDISLAHDMTVGLILNALGYELRDSPPFAAVIVFELRTNDKDEYYVNSYYNDEKITFGMCTEVDCPFKTFEAQIRTRVIPGDIDQLCGDTNYFKKLEDVLLHFEKFGVNLSS